MLIIMEISFDHCTICGFFYVDSYLSLQLQELASQLIDLWNLMDTPPEERALFDHVTCNISASVDEVTAPGALALDLIEQVQGLLSHKTSNLQNVIYFLI